MGKNIPATATADFTSRLHVEREALKAFVTLLETEQQALVSGNNDQLLELAESKVVATQELNKLASMRSESFRALGGKIELGSMTAWLRANAVNSLTVWNDILKLAEQAQQLNSTSGVLIQTRLRHNQQALMALQNAAYSANGLYGPDGQHNLSASGRVLGSV